MTTNTGMTIPSRDILWPLAVWVGLIGGLILTSRVNYLLFHALVEMFAVVVACGIFMIAWNSRRLHENSFFLVIGSASLSVAVIDLLHTLAYKNMGVFPGSDANLPTQLWIAARLLQSVSLLLATLLPDRRPRPYLVLAVSAAVTTLFLSTIFLGLFPDCFREGEGLTPFKRGSEALIILLLAFTLLGLRRKRHSFEPDVLRLLGLSLVFLMGAELAFTFYMDVFGFSNLVGHLFKLAGFYLIYRAVIVTGLSRPVDLLFRDLKARNAELERANRELETFNYTVSHDLRTPLTTVNGYADLLDQFYGESLDEQGKGFLQKISEGIHRMDGIIGDLLQFSRLGRQQLNRQQLDLSDMARAIVRDLQMVDLHRQVAVTVADGAVCSGDPGLMRQALTNLLDNAWKYTGTREQARIDFCHERHKGETVYFIRDNGVGFDMEQAHRLFGTFQRLHDDTEFQGHGIGLATVQRIIELHGGRVWAEGVEGEGAVFYFTLVENDSTPGRHGA